MLNNRDNALLSRFFYVNLHYEENGYNLHNTGTIHFVSIRDFKKWNYVFQL